jgi:hypothetical protein
MPGVKRFTFGQCHAASLIGLTVVLFVVASCEQHREIVGKWRLASGTGETVWEFSKNGAVVVGSVHGRYRFGDQGRIKIETPYAKSVYVFDISAKRMTLRDLSGQKLEFTRISENKR